MRAGRKVDAATAAAAAATVAYEQTWALELLEETAERLRLISVMDARAKVGTVLGHVEDINTWLRESMARRKAGMVSL